jgi:HAD superfamily hydrolase (TIGR01549 family)
MQTPKNEFRYDTVIFDVGGTLLGFHQRAPFQEFLTQAGLPATDDDARQFHRRLVSVIVAARDAAQGLGANETELYDWWRGNFARTWPERPDLADEMLRWLFAGRFDQLYADVLPTLDSLRALDMPLGVLSNFGTHLRDVLHRFDLLRYFEFVVVSAEVGLAKPNPRIFELVVEKAAYPADRLLYVGDHIGDDIEGAWGAGLDAVLIDRGDHQADAFCPRIHSLLDLETYVRQPLRPARAIIFDMDGVVLDSMPAHLLSWQQALAPLGIELTAKDLYPLEGVPTEPTAKMLTEKFFGQPCSDAEAQRLANIKRDVFGQIFRPILVRGIGPLLHDLRGRGYRLGLVTGSARRVVDESLSPTGIAGLFDAAVTGDQVSHGKPDPEPYRTASERLAVPPGECLAVENAPLGIRSARAAGMGCVALQTTLPTGRLTAAGADQVFPDVQALRVWLFLGG